jgi:uncharacterized membrane protein YfcA
MLDLLLPIAGVWINLGAVAAVGLLIGFVSGLFGVGGGFLMTPILIFLGVPPSIAVATGSAQLVASATFSATVAARQRAIDPKLSLFLIGGALTGTVIGIGVFNLLSRLGSLDTVIGVAYVVLLGTVGGLMLKESVTSLRSKNGADNESPLDNAARRWLNTFPFHQTFPRLGVSISLVPLILISLVIGIIGTVLGVGGGFMFVPALIYVFALPTRSAVAASQVQILVTMIAATLLHAIFNHAIDVVLAVPLILGGVLGAHLGNLAGRVVNGVQFRLALAVLILLVACRFLYSLAVAALGGFATSAPIPISFAGLPAWESWIALQANQNSVMYGLLTAFFALLCGYGGARLFDRD